MSDTAGAVNLPLLELLGLVMIPKTSLISAQVVNGYELIIVRPQVPIMNVNEAAKQVVELVALLQERYELLQR